LQRVESRSDRLVDREARLQAEAVAPSDHLRDDRVRMRVLRGREERVDLGLVVDALAESIRPEAAELAHCRGLPERSDLRGKRREQAGHIPKNSRKRGELQSFSFLAACNGLLTTSLWVGLDRVKRASMRWDTER